MQLAPVTPRSAPVAPLPSLPEPVEVPESARYDVPSTWAKGAAATIGFAPGTSPYAELGVPGDSFGMRVDRATPRAAPTWVRITGAFDDAVAAANALALDDTRSVGYGTPHVVFQAARDGAYFIAPLVWERGATFPDGAITLDVDEFGDSTRVADTVTAGSSDLQAVVGVTHWADLRH